MTTSYCMKQKKQTECVSGNEKIVTAKNGRKIMKCICAECAITKTKCIKDNQKGGDLFDTAVGAATDLFVEHALPWMGEKAVEMGRYYGSEALRNKNLQNESINYGLKKTHSNDRRCWVQSS